MAKETEGNIEALETLAQGQPLPEPETVTVSLTELRKMIDEGVQGRIQQLQLDSTAAAPARLDEIPEDPMTAIEARRMLDVNGIPAVELHYPDAWHALFAWNNPANIARKQAVGYVIATDAHVKAAPMAVGDKAQGGCYIHGDTILMVMPMDKWRLYEQAVELQKTELEPNALQRAKDTGAQVRSMDVTETRDN
jgi:hypothetical protein